MAKLALVTGSSAGIGFQIARQLADRGCDIVGVGASDRILGLPEKLNGVTVHPVSVDLASDGGVTSCGPTSRPSANRWTWPHSTPV
jgi:uncharacterized protein